MNVGGQQQRVAVGRGAARRARARSPSCRRGGFRPPPARPSDGRAVRRACGRPGRCRRRARTARRCAPSGSDSRRRMRGRSPSAWRRWAPSESRFAEGSPVCEPRLHRFCLVIRVGYARLRSGSVSRSRRNQAARRAEARVCPRARRRCRRSRRTRGSQLRARSERRRQRGVADRGLDQCRRWR